MRYIVSLISLVFGSLLLNAQNDTLLINDTLIIIEPFEVAEEPEFQCHSDIDITINGGIACKLIFKQTPRDKDSKSFIIVPHAKADLNDNPILYYDHSEYSSSQSAQTILKFGYDTCFVTTSRREEMNRDFKDFAVPADISKIKDWEIDIRFQENGCLDTDYNSVRISKNKSDYIDFSCARNIQVFELDLNHDSLNEIYLISYIWCASEIKIFRIDLR